MSGTQFHPVARHMTHEPYSIHSTETLAYARNLMRTREIRHLPVIDSDRLVGIITDRDIELVAAIPGVELDLVEIGRVMAPPAYVWSETPVEEVARMMARERRDYVVVRGGRGVEGIFTTTDALKALADLIETH